MRLGADHPQSPEHVVDVRRQESPTGEAFNVVQRSELALQYQASESTPQSLLPPNTMKPLPSTRGAKTKALRRSGAALPYFRTGEV